jgi:ParB-like chromosome segregation protein Spo0J
MKKALNIHPVAKLFPTLPAKEMKELKADIATRGIVMPILVNKKRDTILDGRNRWMIAHDLGFKDLGDKKDQVPFDVFDGSEDEAVAEILSRNLFRRHMTDEQRVTLVAKLRGPALEKEAKERMAKKGTFGVNKADGKKGSVAEHVAKEAKVSQHKAEQALKVAKAGLAEDVIANKTSLKKAAKTVDKKQGSKKVAKVVTFEEEVWKRWDKWIKSFTPPQRTQVMELVVGFIHDRMNGKK